jgi:hypothetical protein
MSFPIKIRIGEAVLDAELNDSETARQIADVLPIEAPSFNTWGDEIYFSIPVAADPDDAVETVALGDLGYWPPGRALCIFFGKTPVSEGNEIRPASPVNPIGQVIGDPAVLKTVSSSEGIVIEAA